MCYRTVPKKLTKENYWNFIRIQIEIGDFKSAKKTLKHLKLFSLNSMNASDVIKAIKKEDLDKDFPLNDHDSLKLFDKNITVRWYISRICWQKQEILMNFGEIPANFEWGHLDLNIFLHIHLDLCLLEETVETFETEGSVEAAN